MGFWKSLFSGSSVATSPTFIPVNGVGSPILPSENVQDSQVTQAKIFFSKDRELNLYELEELCDAVGWSRRPIRKVKKALQHSFIVVSMWEQRGSYHRLIGFSRATSDHTFNATIWDVVVHPDFQGQGLGKALMKQIIKELRRAEISNITLFADPHVVNFYRDLGFMPDPEGIKGMFWYPKFH
ncbi:MAG: GNAT family N-acetyltransferase [Acaryochloridaceae cyanobacterium SU_2_1]|nr:GNAT family N-acetyltransferase [Acaryochloridaceae cyanobacterium SU_2_1]